MFDVVTFGSAVVDVFVNTDISESNNKICYQAGTKMLIKELKFDVGGGGTNTAVAFSRFGLKTGFIGKVGDDDTGKRVLNMLKKEKVTFLGKTEKGSASGYSVVLDSREKERTILTYKGINDEISSTDIKKFKTKWLYFSSLLGKSFATQIKLAQQMKKQGTKIAFNPSAYIIKRKNLKPLLKICEVLILNKEEAEMLARSKKQVLEKIHALGPKIVVMTDKNRPIYCYNGIKKYSLMPHKIKVVERTVAGDAFASGFVAGLMANKSIEQALVLALKESESVLGYFGSKNRLLKIKLKK
jgi:ribokinase